MFPSDPDDIPETVQFLFRTPDSKSEDICKMLHDSPAMKLNRLDISPALLAAQLRLVEIVAM